MHHDIGVGLRVETVNEKLRAREPQHSADARGANEKSPETLGQHVGLGRTDDQSGKTELSQWMRRVDLGDLQIGSLPGKKRRRSTPSNAVGLIYRDLYIYMYIFLPRDAVSLSPSKSARTTKGHYRGQTSRKASIAQDNVWAPHPSKFEPGLGVGGWNGTSSIPRPAKGNGWGRRIPHPERADVCHSLIHCIPDTNRGTTRTGNMKTRTKVHVGMASFQREDDSG